MREAEAAAESAARARLADERRMQQMHEIGNALHDLCQPLTTMQCRLEMAKILDKPQDYREAVELGLAECVRLAKAVTLMRSAVRRATQQMKDDADGPLR